MSPNQTPLDTWTLLTRAQVSLTRSIESTLDRAAGIPLLWFDVLHLIDSSEGSRIRMTELATRAGLTKSGLSRVIDRLQSEGLVEQTPASDDHRVHYVTLTPSARNILKAATPVVAERIQKHLTARIDPSQRQALNQLLGKIGEEESLVSTRVFYSTIDSPIGPLLLAASPKGLAQISFGDDPADLLFEEEDAVEAPGKLRTVKRQLDEYFTGRRQRFELPLDWSGIEGFRQRVLKTTARIPFGKVSTYKDVAARAGSPRASRAAGNALGSNPIPIVVPCHRVLHSGGGLGGYGGGLDKKKTLLELEGISV